MRNPASWSGEKPTETQSGASAIARAKSLAATRVGVATFSRAGDPALGDFADTVVLFKAGEVPGDALRGV